MSMSGLVYAGSLSRDSAGMLLEQPSDAISKSCVAFTFGALVCLWFLKSRIHAVFTELMYMCCTGYAVYLT